MAFLAQSSGTGENIIERNVGILVMIKETRPISKLLLSVSKSGFLLSDLNGARTLSFTEH